MGEKALPTFYAIHNRATSRRTIGPIWNEPPQLDLNCKAKSLGLGPRPYYALFHNTSHLHQNLVGWLDPLVSCVFSWSPNFRC